MKPANMHIIMKCTGMFLTVQQSRCPATMEWIHCGNARLQWNEGNITMCSTRVVWWTWWAKEARHKTCMLDDSFPKVGQSNWRCRKSGLWLLLRTKEGIITLRKEHAGSLRDLKWEVVTHVCSLVTYNWSIHSWVLDFSFYFCVVLGTEPTGVLSLCYILPPHQTF